MNCPRCGVTVPESADRCPACQTDLATVPARRTLLESPPRREAEAPKQPRPQIGAVLGGAARGPKPPLAKKKTAGETEAVPFRPVHRQPLALLIALDDGSRTSGETWRVRQPRLVIGRERGDIIIPHDSSMSSEHAEITCQREQGTWRWSLADRNSTNGTYVRASRVLLRGEKELLLGGRRYIFRPPGEENIAAAGGPPATEIKGTQRFEGVSAGPLVERLLPRLVELTAQGDGRAFPLTEAEAWLGSDPARCSVVIGNDPFVSPRHARLVRDDRGRWTIEDADSLNGVWVRTQRMPLEGKTEFQLGEQRFLFRTV